MSLQDRTEAATPKKREDVRGEGRVAKSSDINSAVVLLVSLIILKVAGPYVMQGMSSLTRDTLANLHTQEVQMDSLQSLGASYAIRFVMLCLPIVIGAGALGLATNVLQVGFKVTPKAIAPQLNRLDPFKGLTRVFSLHSLMELLKSVAKVVVVGYFVYAFLRKEYPVLIDLAGLPVPAMAAEIGSLCWRLMMRGCVALIVIGILDYMYQRFHFEKTIRMTKQEVKDEYKRAEGDPQIKGKIKQRQLEMVRRRMIHDVAKADVVITNPTHYAVAIRYDSAEMSAPSVIAKGQRLLAQRIREMAELNGVPIVENPPIARLLYRTVEIGHQVPEELYQTVAEILAYVYQLGKKAAARGRGQ